MKFHFKLPFLLLLFLSIKIQAQQKFILQGWYWDYPKTYQGAFWADTIISKTSEIKKAGFTDVWLPPLSMANTGAYSNGYDIRELFNLGSTAYKTGFGTRSKIDALVSNFNTSGLRVMSDMVYNHRDGGQLETNEAVAGWIKNYNLFKHNSGDQPYPSDRVLMVLPVGGNTGRGAGNYYIKIRSASQSSDYYNKAYNVLAYTGKVGKKNLPDRNESFNNGGADCGQPHDTLKIGVATKAIIDNFGCAIDEFELVLDSLDFFHNGDNIYISLYNSNGDYSDHYIYGLWDAGNNLNIKDSVLYQTKTKFGGLRGQMNKLNFKPNGNPTCLCGDWDSPIFYFDYDQNVSSTRDTLYEWTKWMWTNVGARSFRVDAVKHFSPQFIGNMLNFLHGNGIYPPLFVGESFDYNPFVLKAWTDNVKSYMTAAAKNLIKPSVFDFSLQSALRDACDAFGYDARNVFNSGVVDAAGGLAENTVTFVNNHDFRLASQSVDNDRMLAYAYILTNNKLGSQSVYYTDYYDTLANSMLNKNKIDKLIQLNNKFINNSANRDYLNRFGTPYSANFISGASSNSLIYQLSGGSAGCQSAKDVLVAINFSGLQLKVDQQVNTGFGFNLSVGDTLIDMLGNSSFPYAIVNSSSQVYLQIPGRNYSVWVKGGLTKTPTVTAASGTTICQGDSVLLYAGNVNPCYDYQWQLNNVNIPGANQNTYYAKIAGNYQLQVSQNGVLPKTSSGIFINLNMSMQPSISVQNDTLWASNALNYQWYYSTDSIIFVPISAANAQYYAVSLTGFYFVETIDANVCNAYSATVFINVTGSFDIGNSFPIVISPNPSIDGKFCFVYKGDPRYFNWDVYSVLGSKVASSTWLSKSSSDAIDLSQQPSGVYYLQLKLNQEQKVFRLIKQ